MQRRIWNLAPIAATLFAFMSGAHATVDHPLDPLEDTEILAAAFILQAAGAAQPGAIFQSIDLREPPKDAVLAFVPGSPIPRAASVFYRQNKKSYKTVVNLDNGNVHAAGRNPEERWPARPHDHRGVRLLVRLPGPGVPASARQARHHDAGAARQCARHAAHARLVRAARGVTAHRQGADVLPRERLDQPVCAADRRRAGDHGSRRSHRASGDRHRRRSARDADPRVRRGEHRCAVWTAATDEADRREPAARLQLHDQRQLRRVAEVALPRALRAARGNRDLACNLRRQARAVPGLARGDLRTLPGSGRQLVLPHLHGRRRVRIRPAFVAVAPRARRSADRRAARCARIGGDPGPVGAGGSPAAAAGGRNLRAADRQPGMAAFRAVRRTDAGLRRPRGCRARRALDRPARQLRLHGGLGLQPERHDPRRRGADRHRCAQGRQEHDAREGCEVRRVDRPEPRRAQS